MGIGKNWDSTSVSYPNVTLGTLETQIFAANKLNPLKFRKLKTICVLCFVIARLFKKLFCKVHFEHKIFCSTKAFVKWKIIVKFLHINCGNYFPVQEELLSASILYAWCYFENNFIIHWHMNKQKYLSVLCTSQKS